MSSRTITLQPSTITPPAGDWTYAVKNTAKITENHKLAFAYRKKGSSKIRFFTEEVNPYSGVYFFPYYTQDEIPLLSVPSDLLCGNFFWSLDKGFQEWLTAEYLANRLIEGQSYKYNRYSITLLDKDEMDILAQSFITFPEYEIGYETFRY